MKIVQYKLKDSHPSARVQISYSNSCRRSLTIFKKSWQELSYDDFDSILKEDMQLLDIKNYIVSKPVVVKPVESKELDLSKLSKPELLKWCAENSPEIKLQKSLSLTEIQKIIGV